MTMIISFLAGILTLCPDAALCPCEHAKAQKADIASVCKEPLTPGMRALCAEMERTYQMLQHKCRLPAGEDA